MSKLVEFLRRLRQPMYRVGLLAGGVLLLFQTYRGINALLQKNIQFSQGGWLPCALLLCVIANCIPMLSWTFVMEDLGYHLTLRDVLQGYMLSFLPRYIPGSIWGYLSRSEWLSQQHAVPHTVSNVSSLLEMLFSAWTSVLLAILYFGLVMVHGTGYWVPALLLVAAISGLVCWRISRWPILRGAALAESWNLLRRIPFLGWGRIITLFSVHWILNGGVLWLVLASLGSIKFPSGATTLFETASIYAAAWLIGFLVIFVPAGLGFRESLIAILVASTYGVPIEVASFLSVVMRLLSVISEIMLIAIGLSLKSAAIQNTDQGDPGVNR